MYEQSSIIKITTTNCRDIDDNGSQQRSFGASTATAGSVPFTMSENFMHQSGCFGFSASAPVTAQRVDTGTG